MKVTRMKLKRQMKRTT